MKKIIYGKMYNTGTATILAYWDNGLARSFNYCEESLNRTKHGVYFLYGVGGVRSCYGKSYGYNEYCPGSDISALTEENAKKWAMEHASAEVYEEIFSPVPEA